MKERGDRLRVSQQQVSAIRDVGHFKGSLYGELNIEKTLEFFQKKYIDVVSKHYRAIGPETVVLDVGCGYGWLSHALVMSTGCQVIAVEVDAKRLEAAQIIGRILETSHRVEWLAEPLGSLSLPDRSVDVLFAIEVLEHVDRNTAAFDDLARLVKDTLVITTPNLLFPIIAHDTRLPFCHWLPIRARKKYAQLAGRTSCENDNRFWSARDLDKNLKGFERVSNILHYPGWQEMQDVFPLYTPYRGSGYIDNGPTGVKRMYYRWASVLGSRSHYVMPNLASVYRRMNASPRSRGSE